MNILIRGMEMPKERENFTLTIKYNGLVFDTETGIQVAEAQEVPSHGRLIDADVLIREHRADNFDFAIYATYLVQNAPTILEAEEE